MAAHIVCQLEVDHLLEELHEKDVALVTALRDREAYQLLSRVALAKVAELTTQNDRLRACVRRAIDEMHGGRLSDADGTMGAAA